MPRVYVGWRLAHIRSFRIVGRIFWTGKAWIQLRFGFVRETVVFRTAKKS
jgi:hypothetical protein